MIHPSRIWMGHIKDYRQDMEAGKIKRLTMVKTLSYFSSASAVSSIISEIKIYLQFNKGLINKI